MHSPPALPAPIYTDLDDCSLRRLMPSLKDRLHNSSRPVIDRTRAVCGVEILANSGAIACKIRLAAHPDPAYTDSR